MMRACAVLIALLLGACAIGPASREVPAVYDLGVAREQASNAPRIRATLLVHNVGAPAWLDSPGMVYRLNYQDPAQQLTFAHSRWAMAPAQLVTERLRQRLAMASNGGIILVADAARADYTLRVDLEEFSQVFDSAQSSRAMIAARASLIDVSRRTLRAQQNFKTERLAAMANAEGGVRALAAASDDLIDAIVAWIAATAVPGKSAAN